MISHHVFSAPNLHCSPWFRWPSPKHITSRQPQRQPCRRTQIQTPRRNIRLAHRRLMPSNPQPSQFITFLLQCLPFRSTLAKSPSQSITRGVLSMSLTRRALIQRMAQIGGYSAAFATMQALGLVPTAEASLLPQLPADFGKGKKVVILGEIGRAHV